MKNITETGDSPTSSKGIGERIFKILKGNGFQIKAFNETGDEVLSPADAVQFFVLKPNLMVSFDDAELKISKNAAVDMQEIASVTSAFKLLAAENLINYTIRDFGKQLTPKQFSFRAKEKAKQMSEDKIKESRLGKLHGFRKTSYQSLGEVRMKFTHKKSVNEESPQSRVRHIKSIALEHRGESYDFPCTYVLGARAMARHLQEGGQWDDNVGSYIREISTRYNKMMEFVRYSNRNKNLIEGNADLVRLVSENTNQIRYDLRKFIAPRTFSEFKEKFENSVIIEDDGNASNIKDQFTRKQFENNLESVLPYISNLLKERDDYQSSIRQLVESGVFLSRTPHYTTAITFESPVAQLAYKLKETANLLENEDLSVFLGRVSEKLSTQQKLDEFEVKVVRDILERASIRGNDDTTAIPQEITESYVNKLDRNLYKLVDINKLFNQPIKEAYSISGRKGIDDFKFSHEDSPAAAIARWVELQQWNPMGIGIDTENETDVQSIKRFYTWITDNQSMLVKMMADCEMYNAHMFVEDAVRIAREVLALEDVEIIERFRYEDLPPFDVG